MNNEKKLIDVYSIIKPEIEKLVKSGSETAILDSRVLLAHVLCLTRPIFTHENINISKKEINSFQELIAERENGKPVSRIIKKKNFWKKEFEINQETLDPRPDSEVIIEYFFKYNEDKFKELKILDLGSGSGCLGLSLLDEYQNSRVSFLDVSEKSLQAVEINSLKFNFYKRIQLINLDWSVPDWNRKLLDIEKKIKFDAIVTNPPYIPSKDINFLQKEVKNYEPLIALDGGKDGLDAYRMIFGKLLSLLNVNGKIFVEIGQHQEKSVSQIALDNNLFPIDYGRDLSGIIRVIVLTIK
ncbi:peptide chain release factor N(5)-glutamine methyltransferase [Alphaproteobacteria bacterium]|nr:peptide chain release factor N(5)-glutamine methyltransferase [Alphaproteobacteria bacterium]